MLNTLIQKYNLHREYGGIDAQLLEQCQSTNAEPNINDYVYTYVVINQQVLGELERIAHCNYTSLDIESYNLLTLLNANYLLLEVIGTVEFVHYTSPELYDTILEQGLIPREDYYADLGKGVYVTGDRDYIAEAELVNYFGEYYEENVQLLKVTGTFNGTYKTVIANSYDDDSHIGYIVLPFVTPECIDNLETIWLDDI